MSSTSPDDQTTEPLEAIQFYWRPGCPFCMTLDRALSGIEIPLEKHNIWEDDDAAAFVRSVANGNETVPTVRVGDQFLVNPSAKQVAAAVAQVDPTSVEKMASVTKPGPLGRMFSRLSGGSETNEPSS
jgi:glutaredoxin-like protein